jgi:hypothetical protein
MQRAFNHVPRPERRRFFSGNLMLSRMLKQGVGQDDPIIPGEPEPGKERGLESTIAMRG